MKEERVIFLTHSSPSSKLMAKALVGSVQLVGIVVEKRAQVYHSRIKQLVRSILGQRLYDYLYSVKLYLSANPLEKRILRIERQLQHKANKEFQRLYGNAQINWPSHIPIFETTNINDDRCIAWCRNYTPKLLLVFGTSILRTPLIKVPEIGVLNVHGSILPDYRGTSSEFWQALRNDYEKAGVTIHFIEEGLDTGDIIIQRRSYNTPYTDPYLMRVKNLSIATELLPIAAKSVLEGTAKRKPQAKSSTPTFRSVDITFKKRAELLRRLGYTI